MAKTKTKPTAKRKPRGAKPATNEPAIVTRARKVLAQHSTDHILKDDERAYLLAYEALMHNSPLGRSASSIMELASQLACALEVFKDNWPSLEALHREVLKITNANGMPRPDYWKHVFSVCHFDTLWHEAEHWAWFTDLMCQTNETYSESPERVAMMEAIL